MTFIDKFWGGDYDFVWAGTGATAADPQLQFFENFPGHLGAAFGGSGSNMTLSIHAVNIPLSLSFNQVVFLFSHQKEAGSRSVSNHFGLYSLNGGTLSLANSAGGSYTFPDNATSTLWRTMATSATQNITPGAWYFAFMESLGGNSGSWGWLINSSVNPANAIPGGFLMGRMTVSTGAMPASIATSNLDITGRDATRQPYIIITA